MLVFLFFSFRSVARRRSRRVGVRKNNSAWANARDFSSQECAYIALICRRVCNYYEIQKVEKQFIVAAAAVAVLFLCATVQ